MYMYEKAALQLLWSYYGAIMLNRYSIKAESTH
jgi:hypothetical protein